MAILSRPRCVKHVTTVTNLLVHYDTKQMLGKLYTKSSAIFQVGWRMYYYQVNSTYLDESAGINWLIVA